MDLAKIARHIVAAVEKAANSSKTTDGARTQGDDGSANGIQ